MVLFSCINKTGLPLYLAGNPVVIDHGFSSLTPGHGAHYPQHFFAGDDVFRQWVSGRLL
jgi:hypothetical protein